MKNQHFSNGRSWGGLGVILGRSWVVLGRSWGRLGRSWGGLGSVLGRSWVVLGGLEAGEGFVILASKWYHACRSSSALDFYTFPMKNNNFGEKSTLFQWVVLGWSWGDFGSVLGGLGAVWGRET